MAYVLSQSGPLGATGVLYSANTQGDRQVSFQVMDSGGGSTIAVEVSSDNSSWSASPDVYDITDGNFTFRSGGTINRVGKYVAATDLPYVRLRVSTYVSGNVIVAVEHSAEPLRTTLGNREFRQLLRWQRVMANVIRNNANGKILCLGDSTTRGLSTGGGTGQFPNAYPVRMAEQLAALGIPSSGESFIGSGNVTLTGSDSRITTTGGAYTAVNLTLGGGLLQLTSAGSFSFTPATQCDNFDVYFVRVGGGGASSININGAGSIAISHVGTGIGVQNISATLGNNTLNWVWTSGTCYLLGVVGWNSAVRRVQVINAGGSGVRSSNLVDTAQSYSALNAITTIAPDLAILDIGINDYINDLGIGQYRTNLNRVIDTVRVQGDIVFKVPVWSSINTAAPNGQTASIQKAYIDTFLDVAAQRGVPVIDTRNLFLNFERANQLGYYSDTLHPNASGYAVVGRYVAEAIATRRFDA